MVWKVNAETYLCFKCTRSYNPHGKIKTKTLKLYNGQFSIKKANCTVIGIMIVSCVCLSKAPIVNCEKGVEQ